MRTSLALERREWWLRLCCEECAKVWTAAIDSQTKDKSPSTSERFLLGPHFRPFSQTAMQRVNETTGSFERSHQVHEEDLIKKPGDV